LKSGGIGILNSGQGRIINNLAGS